ncbi:armadillo-type protein [Chytridium lagenaria]|nr:armadillo-type protein [Chytridium lagenaria]
MAQENLEAVLAQTVVPQLSQILASLLLQTDARKAAEDELLQVWQPTRPAELYAGFASILMTNPDQGLRSLAAILLRRLALKVVPNADSNAPMSLLQVLATEQVKDVRHKVCDTASDLCKEEAAVWPEISGAVQEWSRSPNPALRESALRMIAALPSLVELDPAAVNLIVRDAMVSDDGAVKIAALKAAVTLMRVIFEEGDDTPATEAFGQTVPLMLNAVASTSNEEDVLRDGLSALIDVAENAKLFRSQLPQLITFITGLMKNEDLEDSTRQVALELLLGIAENRPPMVRKFQDFTAILVPILLQWMSSIDDSPTWHNTDNLMNDDEDNDENHIIAEQAMDRLSLSLEHSVLPVAFGILPALLGSANWAERHAGLMAISVIGEGCKDVMIEKLEQIVGLVLPYLRSPPPFIFCIKNMCADLYYKQQPIMQEQYTESILTHLVPVMEDVENPDVQKEQIQPFLNDQDLCQEQAITTIATIADSSEEYFSTFYDTIMPLLMNIPRLLRSKAIECFLDCCSLFFFSLALAVGKKGFPPLKSSQRPPRHPADGEGGMTYLFLPLAKPDVAVLDADESEGIPEDGWEFTEIAHPVEMLACYARDLKKDFLPWVEKSLELCIGLLKFYFHEGVRHAAVSTIPLLLGAMQDGNVNPEIVLAAWSRVTSGLFELLQSESEPDFPASIYSAFADCVDELSVEYLPEPLLELFTKSVLSQLEHYHGRIGDRTVHRGDADFDEEEELALQTEEESDESLLLQMSRAVSEVFKKKKVAFLPYFELLLTSLDAMAGFPLESARHFAVCVYGDLIHHAGPSAWSYHPHFVNVLAKGLADTHESIQQASAFAVGLAAQEGGPDFHPMCAQAIPFLFNIVNNDPTRNPDKVLATENAVAAVSRILRGVGDKGLFDFNATLAGWVNAMPILNDQEEVGHTYDYLLSLIESQNPIAMGANNSNFPKLITILTDFIASDLEIEEALGQRVRVTLSALMAAISEQQKGEIWNAMTPGKRQILKLKLGLA